MNIDAWLYNKLANSTTINIYTTKVYPVYCPSTSSTSYIIYDSIGYNKNRILQNKVFTLISCNNSKNNVELMNDAIYNIFDNSTKFQKYTSSNLHIESISILNNSVCIYDQDNKIWQRIIDISIWYS